MSTRTVAVAPRIRSIRRSSFRSSWWLPLELVNISTPSRPIAMCGLRTSSAEHVREQRGTCWV
jgi:hypothetical protein